MNFLTEVARFTRYQDWAPGKIPVLCTILFYIGLANHQVGPAFVLDATMFLIFASLHSAMGYVVNDWGDRELDKQHGKSNAFDRLSPQNGAAALLALIGLAFLSGLYFASRPYVLPLWLTWSFFALAYSLKPLRLKERGIVGISASAIAQWSLPVLLAFAALGRFGNLDMIVFALAVTINGATLEIAHQRHDRVRDLSTQTGTFGTRVASSKLDRLYTAALFMDKVALGIVFAIIMTVTTQLMMGWSALAPLALYVVLFVLSVIETMRFQREGKFLDPYYSADRTAAKLLHETFANLVLPTYVIALATLLHPINGLFLVAFLYWRLILGQADWRLLLRAIAMPFRHARN